MVVAYVPADLRCAWDADDGRFYGWRCEDGEDGGDIFVVASAPSDAHAERVNGVLRGLYTLDVPSVTAVGPLAGALVVEYDVSPGAGMDLCGPLLPGTLLGRLAAAQIVRACFSSLSRADLSKECKDRSKECEVPLKARLGRRTSMLLAAYARVVCAAMSVLVRVDAGCAGSAVRGPGFLAALWRTLKAHSALHANLSARWCALLVLARAHCDAFGCSSAGTAMGDSFARPLVTESFGKDDDLERHFSADEASKRPSPADEASKRLLSADEGAKRPFSADEGTKMHLSADEGTKRPSPADEALKRPSPADETPKRLSPADKTPKRLSLADVAAQRRYMRATHEAVLRLANDAAVGAVIGAALVAHARPAAALCGRVLFGATVVHVEAHVTWLMGWPAGLKLNANLDKFMGEMTLWLVAVWTVAVAPLARRASAVVVAAGVSSAVLGASTALALAADGATLLTLHLPFFYALSARLYAAELRVLTSLLHLFRGRKWNVLRSRLDSADYELDQLLLGTVLLALLAFLLPTVAVYYALFLATRVLWSTAVLGVFHAAHGALMDAPLYALAARVLADPQRVPAPGGLVLDVHAGLRPCGLPSHVGCLGTASGGPLERTPLSPCIRTCQSSCQSDTDSSASGPGGGSRLVLRVRAQSVAAIFRPVVDGAARALGALFTRSNAVHALRGDALVIAPGVSAHDVSAEAARIAAVRSEIALVRLFADRLG